MLLLKYNNSTDAYTIQLQLSRAVVGRQVDNDVVMAVLNFLYKTLSQTEANTKYCNVVILCVCTYTGTYVVNSLTRVHSCFIKSTGLFRHALCNRILCTYIVLYSC